MALNRVHAEFQDVRDFFVRFSLGHQLEDLFLPRRQQVVAVLNLPLRNLAHVVLQQHSPNDGTEKRLSLGNRANGLNQVSFGRVL